MWLYFLLTVLGFAMLYAGAEWLVKGAASLARGLGVSPVIIGLTVVAFGTSAPELVISVMSSVSGRSMIAVGNAVGSNICNTTLVLGLAAIIMPVPANASLVRRDMPLMLAISLFLVFFFLNSTISRLEGVLLFAGIMAYVLFNYRLWKQSQSPAVIRVETEPPAAAESGFMQAALILAGIAFVITGAQVLIDSVVAIMERLGATEKFIGLTVVAVGTSLPELATSVVAAVRKEMDISIGNLIGSNVFNLLGVIGAAAIVRPIVIPGGFAGSGLAADYQVMLLAGIVPWILMRRDFTLHRFGGTLLLLIYISYIGYLFQYGM